MIEERKAWLRGVLLIFSAYFYFLIFAQFAFLELVRDSGVSATGLKLVLGAMAMGGVAGSFLAPLFRRRVDQLMRGGLAGCSLAAAAAFIPGSFRIVAASLVGLSLGVLTVSLATALRVLFSSQNWGLGAALGTGAAYFVCNVPLVFQGTAKSQTILAGVLCLVAQLFVPRYAQPQTQAPQRSSSRSVPFYLLFFGLLVWLDSAAFYIIQHSQLKLGTWGSAGDLWRNAVVHLAGALAGGVLVQRHGFRFALWAAFALLGPAALLANSPETRSGAGCLYPAGVSIYSACLVALPAFGPGEMNTRAVARRAALLYALCGWICSGLGIGMAENLHRVPWEFVTIAAAILAAAALMRTIFSHRRELAYAALVLVPAAAFATARMPNRERNRISGREVYISEGCINCHSQYVRPGSHDELTWGPAQRAETLQADAPPLFGNRRQGPDLLNVGNRRSRAWLKQHFLEPRSLAPGSSMPAYSYLFADGRGEALIDYLLSLGREDLADRLTMVQSWRPGFVGEGSRAGEQLFALHCAACHGEKADGGGPLAPRLLRPPANLSSGPWIYAPPALDEGVRRQRLAQIIKFGLPGTDMPGHEYFSDSEVLALTFLVERLAGSRE